MRRKRRTKYTWFPVLGTLSNGTSDLGGLAVGVNVPFSTLAGGNVVLTAIIPDLTPEDVSGGQDQLVDYIGTEYFIKRIVGKIHMGYEQDSGTFPDTAILACGLFVARAENNGVAPISAVGVENQNYGPLHPDTYQRPWIWRRTWAMSNLNATGALRSFPTSTAQGSVLDGPHVDAKTARKVGKDERLWFAAQAFSIPANTATQNGTISGYVDFRVLGRLSRSHNRSAF